MSDADPIPGVMLAKASPSVPAVDALPGGCCYEPKWDGFRALVVRGPRASSKTADGTGEAATDLIGRSGKSLARYFPEVLATARAHLPAGSIVDAELVVRAGSPGAERLDWDALTARIHPAASRISLLAEQTPAELVCFDLLADSQGDLLQAPFRERRGRLRVLLGPRGESPGIHLTRTTDDPEVAQHWFETFEGAGLDGIMAKGWQTPYQPGKRTMLKVKHHRTAEAVVVGYRVHKSGSGVGSMLLGLYHSGELLDVGGASAFTAVRRAELVDELEPYVARGADGSPATASREPTRFSSGKDTSYVPLRPVLVAEVAFDQREKHRFRHAVKFLRWRPDRDPESCTLEQVEHASGYDLGLVLGETDKERS